MVIFCKFKSMTSWCETRNIYPLIGAKARAKDRYTPQSKFCDLSLQRTDGILHFLVNFKLIANSIPFKFRQLIQSILIGKLSENASMCKRNLRPMSKSLFESISRLTWRGVRQIHTTNIKPEVKLVPSSFIYLFLLSILTFLSREKLIKTSNRPFPRFFTPASICFHTAIVQKWLHSPISPGG